MSEFVSSMFGEIGARRRRMRAAFGDRGQAIVEFLVLAGLAIGSLGLVVRPGMTHAAPWGWWLPIVFVAGFIAIEARRQAQSSAVGDEARQSARYDWIVFLWSFGCALLGVAAFVLAWTAQARPPAHEEWTPPREAVDVDISP